MGFVCRPLKTDSEIKAAALIEKSCLSTCWSEQQIASLPEYASYIAAFDGNEPVGIASMYTIAGEGQIMNLAVLMQYRKKGIGKMLMDSLLKLAKEKNCLSVSLEVAKDNIGAITLYKKCGFLEVGQRKGFYNGTDAIIMEITL